MGGNAFDKLNLGDNAFPRMPPDTYQTRKRDIHEKLCTLFGLVGTPIERPNKSDYGDIDFVVCEPRLENVTLDLVKATINAQHLVESRTADRLGTSNFALSSTTDIQGYYQVDVNICIDRDEWNRVMFFHSYGDFGMILGLMFRAYGLSVGTKGLRVISPKSPLDSTPLPSLHLSSSFPEILPFFGLPYSDWERGFTDTQSLFEWLSTSPYFNPRRFARVEQPGSRRHRLKNARSMYREFVEYATNVVEQDSGELSTRKGRDNDVVLQEALEYFNKREEFNMMASVHGRRKRIKAQLSGTKVMEWTGLNGRPIGKIIEVMRSRFSDDKLLAFTEESLKETVLAVQKELGYTQGDGTALPPGPVTVE